MSRCVPYFLAFDPTVAASDTTQDSGGGDVTTGTPTIYSKHSDIPGQSIVTEIIKFTRASGTFAGTLTVEVSNSPKQDDENAGGLWDTYDNFAIAIPAISTGTSQTVGLEMVDFGWGRMRTKFVVSGGTGTVKSERTIKGGV